MKTSWTVEDLVYHFTLQADEREFIGINAPHNQLGKAILLKLFQYEARFPQDKPDISNPIIEFIAQQLYISPEVWLDYQWNESRMREHRQQIRDWLGFRRASTEDQRAVTDWLVREILPGEYRLSHLREIIYQHLKDQQLEPPSEEQLERIINSALHRYQAEFFRQTYQKLPQVSRIRLRNLLSEASSWTEQTSGYPLLHEMKLGPGSANVKHIRRVCERLRYLQAIELPNDLFDGIPMKYLRQFQRQVSVESPSHLLRREANHPEQMYSLLAAFCWVRQREVTDDLVDLFIRVAAGYQSQGRAQRRETLNHGFHPSGWQATACYSI